MSAATTSLRFSDALAVTCLVLSPISARARVQQPPSKLETEVQEVRSENTAVREERARLAEQQKILLNVVDQLQQRLNGSPAAVAQQSPAAPPCQQPKRDWRRNPHHPPQIETLPPRIPTKTVSFW
jgi:hypothetical protein